MQSDILTQRQIEILKALVQEYITTGEPVGSCVVEKKYRLGCSPATIRNEMVELAAKGYLKKDHFSSGRIPSAQGFRFYLQYIMKEKSMSSLEEMQYKNSVWDDRAEKHRMLQHAVRVLADRTGMLSVVATDDGVVYSAGIGKLMVRIAAADVVNQLCETIDAMQFWVNLARTYEQSRDVMVYLGEEDFGDPLFESLASVMGDFHIAQTRGIVGIVGPKYMSYDVYTPHVRYFSHLLEQIASWKE